MKPSKFRGAVFILRPEDNASALAEYISENYFESSEYHYRISDAIPENIQSAVNSVTRQALEEIPGARVMLFIPQADTNIMAEKTRNGQIPS